MFYYNGLTTDRKGYERKMAEQRAMPKSAKQGRRRSSTVDYVDASRGEATDGQRVIPDGRCRRAGRGEKERGGGEGGGRWTVTWEALVTGWVAVERGWWRWKVLVQYQYRRAKQSGGLQRGAVF